jgi:hypothetical protein
MPSKKSIETHKKAAGCILKYGKSNNVIQWAEEMQTAVTALYGLTGIFFTTNQSYIPPRVREQDILQEFYESDEDELEDYDEDEDDEEAGVRVLTSSQTAAHTARAKAKAARDSAKEARVKKDEKILYKICESKHDRRLKLIDTIRENEQKIYPMMWVAMSPASQTRVKEEEDFEEVRLTLDFVRLWGFIRETHLTHIFGMGDPMKELNALEQENRFNRLIQGDREFIDAFKARFDNQLRANEGAGVPMPNERKLALKFITKLDPKRYKQMLSQMRSD